MFTISKKTKNQAWIKRIRVEPWTIQQRLLYVCILKEAMGFIIDVGNKFENGIKHIFFEIRDGKYKIPVLLTVKYNSNMSLPTAKRNQQL